jgi:hypothetical protein
MAEVGSAVEHADRDPGAVEAGAPGAGEVVGLGVHYAEPLELLEVRALERRGLAERHLTALVLLLHRLELRPRRPALQRGVGVAQRPARPLHLDQADRTNGLDPGQLRHGLDADPADQQRGVRLAARRLVVGQQRLDLGEVTRCRDEDRHGGGRSGIDLLAEGVVELRLPRVRAGRDLLRCTAVARCRGAACGHDGQRDDRDRGEQGKAELVRPCAHIHTLRFQKQRTPQALYRSAMSLQLVPVYANGRSGVNYFTGQGALAR